MLFVDRPTKGIVLRYTHPLSANAPELKLLLGFLDLAYEEQNIGVPGGEQRKPG